MRTITLDRAGDEFCIVDDDDYEWLIKHRWWLYSYKGCKYAVRQERRITLYMHREIAKKFISGRTRKRNLVDHINSNGLNNTRDNLRWVTPKENRHNQNGAKWRHMTDLYVD